MLLVGSKGLLPKVWWAVPRRDIYGILAWCARMSGYFNKDILPSCQFRAISKFTFLRQVGVHLLESSWDLAPRARSEYNSSSYVGAQFLKMGWSLFSTPRARSESKPINPSRWDTTIVPRESRAPIPLGPGWRFLEMGLYPCSVIRLVALLVGPEPFVIRDWFGTYNS